MIPGIFFSLRLPVSLPVTLGRWAVGVQGHTSRTAGPSGLPRTGLRSFAMRESLLTLEVRDRSASGTPWPDTTLEVGVMTIQAASDGGTAAEQIAVFLLDDHEVVRRGVRDLLEAEPDIKVVGEAGTASSALARIPALRPDAAGLDVRLPDGDGVTVCREIRSRMPEVACLMLTSFGDDEALFDAIMAGAAGYVLKQIRGTD